MSCLTECSRSGVPIWPRKYFYATTFVPLCSPPPSIFPWAPIAIPSIPPVPPLVVSSLSITLPLSLVQAPSQKTAFLAATRPDQFPVGGSLGSRGRTLRQGVRARSRKNTRCWGSRIFYRNLLGKKSAYGRAGRRIFGVLWGAILSKCNLTKRRVYFTVLCD